MKIIALSFFTLLFTFLSAQIPTNGLVGHYAFDGNTLDASVSGNHAIESGCEYTTDRFGNQDAALYLDGISDSVRFPIPEFAPITGDFTISFWYRTNSPKIMNLISSKQFASDTTDNFEIQLNSHNRFYLENYMQSFYQTYAYWNGTGGLSNDIAEGAPGAFSKGEWCHFAITRAADTLRIYRNHSLYYLSIDNFYGGMLGDAVDLIFSSNPFPFKGSVDDFRFYNRNLDQAEIDLLWFENRPFSFLQVKSTDAYVRGSNLLISWEYDVTQISDSILVESRINGGAWTPVVHTNYAYESYTYVDMTYPTGTRIEVRVSDFSNPALTESTGELTVSEYDWVEVSDSLPFHPKDGSGLINFQGKMWLLGGWDPPYNEPTSTNSDVWSSVDGLNWEFVTDAPWPPRHCASWLVGAGAMWVIGGDPQSGCLTDVWKSEDGINWIETNHAIPGFVMRNNPNYAFFNEKLHIYGGEQCGGGPLNDMWTSSDGVSWNQETSAPWIGRGMQVNNCVDGNGQMWMLGGASEGTRRSYNEVWKSADGINWTLVNESAPWSGRYWHTVAWFDNKMWLMGGMATGTEMNDVWYSEDGITWKELKSTTGNWPEGTRHAQSTTVYDNAVWYMCGINSNNSWKIVNTENTNGIKENQADKLNISVFPNPVKDKLTLSFTSEKNEENTIQIFSITGVLMKEVKTQSSESKSKLTIDVSDLPSGLYIARIKNQSIKFVKQ